MKHSKLLGRILALGALSACAPAPQPPADAAHPPAPAAEAPAAQAFVADPDLAIMAELAVRGPDAKQYPQASAVMALVREEITLAPDGTLIEHVKSIVKILDAQRGKERFADVHIPFDRKRQKLEVAVARTVNADGAPHSIS
ncbi:MAG TPA: DUF3857 domain-containing protein, partial [Polyangiaceae bacterium]|nr:DUF3857 domain-containing protein [Polyangiaceae bacterium]